MKQARLSCAVLAIAFLTACGGAEGEQVSGTMTLPPKATIEVTSSEPVESTTAATITSATPAPSTSSRGLLVKTLGQEAGFGEQTASGDLEVMYTVDAIEVDPGCTGSYAQPSELGHFLVVSIRMSTSSALTDQLVFTTNDWHVVNRDGVRENTNDTSAAYSCIADSGRFPDGPLPTGTQLVGQFALDSAETSGFLTYTPPFLTNGGWEWSF